MMAYCTAKVTEQHVNLHSASGKAAVLEGCRLTTDRHQKLSTLVWYLPLWKHRVGSQLQCEGVGREVYQKGQ